jgi:hypothetical protein
MDDGLDQSDTGSTHLFLEHTHHGVVNTVCTQWNIKSKDRMYKGIQCHIHATRTSNLVQEVTHPRERPLIHQESSLRVEEKKLGGHCLNRDLPSMLITDDTNNTYTRYVSPASFQYLHVQICHTPILPSHHYLNYVFLEPSTLKWSVTDYPIACSHLSQHQEWCHVVFL